MHGTTHGGKTTLESMLQGYLDCALWASTQRGRDCNGRIRDDKPLEDFRADWTASARKSAREDCADFLEANRADCEEYVARRGSHSYLDPNDPRAGHPWEYLGHDFYLTRNRHGAGFWDRGLGDLGKRLTEAAHVYGETYHYVHKGRIYGQ